jgi:predicted AlkP superfamily pyrophosphatase or phosphodiesterase
MVSKYFAIFILKNCLTDAIFIRLYLQITILLMKITMFKSQKIKIIYLFIVTQLQFTYCLFSQTSKPSKLIIGIVVDQMRNDYLYRFERHYGKGGFKRLIQEGYYYKNTHYSYVPTYTGPGHASIYTGTTPRYHGIISNDWFDKYSGEEVYCVSDSTYNTIGNTTSDGKMSPKNLFATTITDELRYSTNFKGKVIGISLKDRGAILPAGHSANAAYWLSGKDWVTSSYYMNELPNWVVDFNSSGRVEKYIANDWNTLLPISEYTESIQDDNDYEMVYKGEDKPVFPHKLSILKDANYGNSIIKGTPFGDTVMEEFAEATIENESLGKDEITDFLALSFSAIDYVGHRYGPNSIEMEDAMIRLDKDIEKLLNFLDLKVGKGHYQIFLTADHAGAPVASYMQANKIAGGYMDYDLIDSLLTIQITKKFGNFNFIKNFSNDQFFYDHDLLATKNIDETLFSKLISKYLVENFKEISEVFTADQLKNTQFTEGIESFLKKGYNTKRSGDLLIVPQVGFIDYGEKGTTHGTGYSFDTHVPLIFFGNGIRNGSSSERVLIEDIAPTISILNNLNFPNACTGKPLWEVVGY